MALKNYSIKCLTEGIYVSTWSDDTPTTCPNNATHIIDSDMTMVVETLKLNVLRFSTCNLSCGVEAFPEITTSGPITGYAFSDTISESVYGNFNIPQNWKYGIDTNIRINFFNDYSQVGNKNCKWVIEYKILQCGTTLSGTVSTNIHGVCYLPENAQEDTLMYADIVLPYDDTYNPVEYDRVMYFRVYRDISVPDNMVGDAILTNIFFMFQESYNA